MQVTQPALVVRILNASWGMPKFVGPFGKEVPIAHVAFRRMIIIPTYQGKSPENIFRLSDWTSRFPGDDPKLLLMYGISDIVKSSFVRLCLRPGGANVDHVKHLKTLDLEDGPSKRMHR